MVVYSAGYRSPHGHPHPQVRRAFQSIGSREWNTADSGAIVFKWSRGKLQSVTAYREFKHRYWFD
jgi:competence protein ComEC